jgi:hypothetical protein
MIKSKISIILFLLLVSTNLFAKYEYDFKSAINKDLGLTADGKYEYDEGVKWSDMKQQLKEKAAEKLTGIADKMIGNAINFVTTSIRKLAGDFIDDSTMGTVLRYCYDYTPPKFETSDINLCDLLSIVPNPCDLAPSLKIIGLAKKSKDDAFMGKWIKDLKQQCAMSSLNDKINFTCTDIAGSDFCQEQSDKFSNISTVKPNDIAQNFTPRMNLSYLDPAEKAKIKTENKVAKKEKQISSYMDPQLGINQMDKVVLDAVKSQDARVLTLVESVVKASNDLTAKSKYKNQQIDLSQLNTADNTYASYLDDIYSITQAMKQFNSDLRILPYYKAAKEDMEELYFVSELDFIKKYKKVLNDRGLKYEPFSFPSLLEEKKRSIIRIKLEQFQNNFESKISSVLEWKKYTDLKYEGMVATVTRPFVESISDPTDRARTLFQITKQKIEIAKLESDLWERFYKNKDKLELMLDRAMIETDYFDMNYAEQVVELEAMNPAFKSSAKKIYEITTKAQVIALELFPF